MSAALSRSGPVGRGFTLIELIVVIVILGVLAAFAMPRFINLQSEARVNKAIALAGAVRTAATLAKAQAIVDNVSCSAATSDVTLEGSSVALAYCTPAASSTGIVLAANINTINDAVTVAHAAGSTTFTMANASTPTDCRVTYTPASVADGVSQVSVATSGC